MSIHADPSTVHLPEDQSPKWNQTYMLCSAPLALTAKFHVNLTTCLTMATATTPRKVLDTIHATVNTLIYGSILHFIYSLINKYLLNAY